MIYNLLNTSIMSNKINEGATPDAVVSLNRNIDLNNGGWIAIGIMLALIVILIFIIYIIASQCKNLKLQNKSENTKQQGIMAPEENNILTEYNKLTPEEKQVILETIKTFNNSKHK